MTRYATEFVRRGRTVLRADGSYLYALGWQIHPLNDFKFTWSSVKGTALSDAVFPLLRAESALDGLLNNSIYQLRTARQSGLELLAAVKALRATFDSEAEKNRSLTAQEIFSISNPLGQFEAILAAELSLVPLYFVTQKSGFDTNYLVDRGEACFPVELATKVPLAIPDVREAARCIAFALPTAAAFHLHRANESVLGSYWDVVSKGEKRPRTRNMGDYLKIMDAKNYGAAKVRSSLRDIKDHHRNPIIHPETSLGSVDEAIALMNAIHTAVTQMLKEIPFLPNATPTIGGVAP